LIYAGIVILNRLCHKTGTLLDGFAGGYKGIPFVLIGRAMIYYLRLILNLTAPVELQHRRNKTSWIEPYGQIL
jgi:hypothetical protein